MKERIIKGIGAIFIGRLLTFVSRIVLVPLFITAWGVNIYGDWLLLSSMVAYLALSDLGGQHYVVNLLNQSYSQGDYHQFIRTLHTGLALFLILPSVFFAIFTFFFYIIKPQELLGISTVDNQTVFLVLAILALQIVISLPHGIILGIYRATGLLPRGVMLGNMLQLISIILVSAGLMAKCNMIIIAFLQLLPYGFVTAIAIIDLNKQFPTLHLFTLKDTDLSYARTFLSPSLHFLAIQFSQAISIQGTVIVVGIILTPVHVVLFTTMRTLVNVLRQLIDMAVISAWPEMTRLDAVSNIQQLTFLFRCLIRTTLVATVITCSLLHIFGESIFTLWLGNKVIFDQKLFDLFLIYVYQLVLWLTYRNLLMSTNKHLAVARLSLISSLISIFLAYFCCLYYDLNGLLYGLIIGDLILPFWFIPYLVHNYNPLIDLNFFLTENIPIISSALLIYLFPLSAPLLFILLLVWLFKIFHSTSVKTSRVL